MWRECKQLRSGGGVLDLWTEQRVLGTNVRVWKLEHELRDVSGVWRMRGSKQLHEQRVRGTECVWQQCGLVRTAGVVRIVCMPEQCVCGVSSGVWPERVELWGGRELRVVLGDRGGV